jgi:rare lipoprotein A
MRKNLTLRTASITVLIGCNLTVLSLANAQDAAVTPATDTPPAVATDIFPDLPVGNQYYVGVKYLKDLGLVQGYPDGTFQPLKQINRAEALKVLVGAIEYNSFSPIERPLVLQESTPDNSTLTCPFPDLDTTAWYYRYVCEAFQNGVVSGYPDGTFKPEQTINKVEALKMDLLQGGIPLQTSYTDNFDDISPSDWFWDYARIADEKSIIVSDRQGNLNPAETLNRGEFAMLVYRTIRALHNHSEFGRATYYGGRFDGQGTASGEIFLNSQFTAAHKTLPFNTIVRVTNLANGKQVLVRINDRGPYVNGTIIDLSDSAFAEIASLSTGVVHSEVEIVTPAP